MVIQVRNTTIILQMYNSIKYINSLAYNDYTLQAWGKSDKWS